MKDNSTGKDKEFYERGKKMFDRLNPPPVQREWVGLTDEEATECWSTSAVKTWLALEAKLKEKNS